MNIARFHYWFGVLDLNFAIPLTMKMNSKIESHKTCSNFLSEIKREHDIALYIVSASGNYIDKNVLFFIREINLKLILLFPLKF